MRYLLYEISLFRCYVTYSLSSSSLGVRVAFQFGFCENGKMFGLTLEKWSYLATTISGAAAALLVALAVFQLWALGRQVKLGTGALKQREMRLRQPG